MFHVNSLKFNSQLLGMAMLLIAALHPSAWKINQHTFTDDSLFVLSPIEIIGLIVLTSLMAIVLLLININKTRYLHLWLNQTNNKILYSHYWFIPFDLFLTIILFFLFWAIAPQIHYIYYQQIMDGLQNQWVIGGGIKVDRAIRFITLSEKNSIADHANGIALWLCMLCSSLYPIINSKPLKPEWPIGLLSLAIIFIILRLIQILILK